LRCSLGCSLRQGGLASGAGGPSRCSRDRLVGGTLDATMVYRDDREALLAEISVLEAENAALRQALVDLRARLHKIQQLREEARQQGQRSDCLSCGGHLLPVAVFAGHDFADPQPMHLSTLRFRGRKGGFTHAAPIHAYACSNCGFIQHFVATTAALHDDEEAA
jgi:hypothetical protein